MPSVGDLYERSSRPSRAPSRLSLLKLESDLLCRRWAFGWPVWSHLCWLLCCAAGRHPRSGDCPCLTLLLMPCLPWSFRGAVAVLVAACAAAAALMAFSITTMGDCHVADSACCCCCCALALHARASPGNRSDKVLHDLGGPLQSMPAARTSGAVCRADIDSCSCCQQPFLLSRCLAPQGP